MSQQIVVEKQGRRHYILGNTYPIKDQLRNAGCKWDRDRKAWYTGKADVAERIMRDAAPSGDAPGDAPGVDATVAGKATYKGRTYYIAGKLVRGWTRWDDSVEAVTTRDGAKLLLLFRDGSKSFWAARGEVQIAKSYIKPKTIASLQRFADEAKAARAQGNDDGVPDGRRYECEECGEYVTRGDGSSCWETGCAH